MEYQQEERPRYDADDLLLNGFWKSTRAQNVSRQVSTSGGCPMAEDLIPYRITSTVNAPMKTMKTQRRAPRDWPPQPVVEDEVDSLAKELAGADIRPLDLASIEPPFRGAIDQNPIILESSISMADANKLYKELHAECQAEESSERRFVLLKHSDIHALVYDGVEASQSINTAPQTSRAAQNGTVKRTSEKPEGLEPRPLERGSRQDLPSIQTEMPSFRRSTSAYTYTPSSKQSAKSPRTSDECLSFPGATTSRAPFTSNPSTQAAPALEKRDSDTYVRSRQDLSDKLTTPKQLSTDGGARRSERTPSTNSHLETLEHAGQGKGLSQSTRRHNSSSDDDKESSDSDRRRRRHRHQNSLRPGDDQDRHRRSGSNVTRSSDRKSGSRYSPPLATPNISPSQLPPLENIRNATLSPTRDGRRPISKPVSPLSSYTEPSHLDMLNDSGRSRARSPVRSRRSSPVDILGARSAGRTSSSTLPIPIPTRGDLHSPSDSRRSPSQAQFEADYKPASTRPSPSPNRPWQPPSFQPPLESSYSDRPTGSYRRYSQDVDDGTIAPLPPCPRTTLSRGHNDWLTLPGALEFNICPSCFDSTMARTEFYDHFVLAPKRSLNEEVICDFGSQPWYRIAWLLTRKDRRRDLSLMSSLAHICATTPHCLGKHEVIRKWYSIIDPETGQPIRNFDVCLACVESIETLLPELKGIFVRNDQSFTQGKPAICDMRFDSKRFIHYFDALEIAADTASDSRYPPNTSDLPDLVELVKRFASLPECHRDEVLSSAYWYTITQLPDFTVCPECFHEVVYPALEKGKAIPAMFSKMMQRVSSASCQLYSPRMRAIFQAAVDGNDFKFLAAKARDRRSMELRYKVMLEQKRFTGGEREVKRIENEWAKWE